MNKDHQNLTIVQALKLKGICGRFRRMSTPYVNSWLHCDFYGFIFNDQCDSVHLSEHDLIAEDWEVEIS